MLCTQHAVDCHSFCTKPSNLLFLLAQRSSNRQRCSSPAYKLCMRNRERAREGPTIKSIFFFSARRTLQVSTQSFLLLPATIQVPFLPFLNSSFQSNLQSCTCAYLSFPLLRWKEHANTPFTLTDRPRSSATCESCLWVCQSLTVREIPFLACLPFFMNLNEGREVARMLTLLLYRAVGILCNAR